MLCWWARAMVESTDTAMTNLGRFTWRGRHRAGRHARRGSVVGMLTAAAASR